MRNRLLRVSFSYDSVSVAGKLPRVTSLRAQQVARLTFKAVKRKMSALENGDHVPELGPVDETKSATNNLGGGIHLDNERLLKKGPGARKRGRPPKNAHKRVTLNGVNGQSVENGESPSTRISAVLACALHLTPQCGGVSFICGFRSNRVFKMLPGCAQIEPEEEAEPLDAANPLTDTELMEIVEVQSATGTKANGIDESDLQSQMYSSSQSSEQSLTLSTVKKVLDGVVNEIVRADSSQRIPNGS